VATASRISRGTATALPIAASGEKTAKIVKGAQLKVYKGGSHGLAQVDPDTFNADVLAFVRS
jgi:non-heme chloroperoxidase